MACTIVGHCESAERGSNVHVLRDILPFAAPPVTEAETIERAGAALDALTARVTPRVNRHRERHGNIRAVMGGATVWLRRRSYFPPPPSPARQPDRREGAHK